MNRAADTEIGFELGLFFQIIHEFTQRDLSGAERE
jgi:hypothetical protein